LLSGFAMRRLALNAQVLNAQALNAQALNARALNAWAFIALALIAAGLCTIPELAAAQTTSERAQSEQGQSEWTFTLGPGLQIAPAYEGANHYALLPFPWIGIGLRGRVPAFSAPDDSPGLALTSGVFRLGAVVHIRGERHSRGERVGLPELVWALEPGLSGEVWPMPWLRTRVELRKGVRGHVGWVADFGADAVGMRGPWTFSIGPRLGYGNPRYMQTYFGVTPAEAAANPVIDSAYGPDAGLRYAGASVSALHRRGRWTGVAGLAYHRLVGDAAASPLVTQLGDTDQLMVNLGVMFTFNSF